MVIKEIDIHNFFIDYLISKGFPNNSITVHPLLEDKSRPDIIIVDPVTNKPLAIFEVKREKSNNTISISEKQLIKYAQAIKNPDIPLFAVFPIAVDNALEFEFFTVSISPENKETGIISHQVTLPTYNLLKNSRLTEELSKISDQRERTIGIFEIICWILAVFVLIVLIADLLNIFKIDFQQLGLIGLIIGLIILPYANKLKILGFEFERLTQSKKDKDEK
jgi:Type I restriction enzyme R protein N terminus (HSDR_N).